ncbi:hypothetical protein [Actinoplanes sp. NPDC049118]|uniref:hypothetical protein n=1 Tax=Actinoplanes sp. NPDC049118 TaxID=3155769 RepID=UPI00340777C7
MRTWRILALGLLLTAAATGCGGKPAGDQVASAGGTPTASAAAAAEEQRDEDAPLKFSQCMREQGMTWFPDPKPGGGLQIKVPKGTAKEKVDAAMEACKKWAPDGGDRGPADPEQLEQARQMARCMRENGVENFPDPNPDGSIRIDGRKVGMGPGDPTFDKAEEACSKYRPDGPGPGGDKRGGTSGGRETAEG